MKRLSQAVVVVLIVVVLAACVSVDDGATPEVVVEGDGETVTAVPPTTLPDTPTPTSTPAPSRTPTITPEPSPTPSNNTNLFWTENVIEIYRVNGNSIVWSAVINEFVFDYCPDPEDPEPLPNQIVFVVSSPDFIPQNVTPQNFTCDQSTRFIWRPDTLFLHENVQIKMVCTLYTTKLSTNHLFFNKISAIFNLYATIPQKFI